MIEKLLKKDEIISHLNVREYLNITIIIYLETIINHQEQILMLPLFY